MEILYIVMPAYNEEENIRDVVNAWYPLLEGKANASRLVIADSGSTDKTHSILLDMKNNLSHLEILSDTEKQHGPKVIALYDYAIKKGANYIFQTDSDGQTDPDEFETFWGNRKKFDGIFGNRIHRGDGKQRKYVERVVCMLLKLYFGVDIPDANAPFRLMKAEIVKKYLYKLPTEYNLPNIMMTTYFVYHREKVAFCDISFKSRQRGKNSINMRKIVKIGWKALGDFKMLKKDINNIL